MSGYVRAYEGNDPYLFVSYAHKDSDMVLPVIRELYNQKYRVWYDEGIAPGSEWPQNIARHLQEAAAVIVFVSENSLASSNCENEVAVATEQKKKTIPICLDGASKHSLLSDIEALHLDEGLINRLTNNGYIGSEFIGDGIAGYQYAIGTKKSFNIWNLMLGFAAVLAIAFSVSLYGLYNGWFDNLLPAKQQSVLDTIAPAAQQEAAIPISSNIIGSVLPVRFSSDEEKNAVYQKLGWTQPFEITYNDLLGMNGLTHLEISNEPIYDIAFAAYFPNLEVITLSSSQITDLSPLVECQKLKTVQISADMLPLTLPKIWNFEIEVI
ncbi:MAG: toll/interleukin-1 receptor domain-containing protein [Christensenellales bacterium]